MGVPLKEHIQKVKNQVIGRDEVKRGGIYRKYSEAQNEDGEFGNWFIVVKEPYWHSHAYRIKVYDLEKGRYDKHFLGDLGVMSYSEDSYNGSNALQRHPDGLRVPEKCLIGKSWITRFVRFLFG